MSGLIVNKNELAKMLGVSLVTVTTWVKTKDCPYVEKPDLSKGSTVREWKFNSADVINWLINERIKNAYYR